jgi:uroporphyrinogen III methyltransferase/synthase
VVLYDYLVNPAVLEHAPSEAELVCLGSHRCGRVLSQEEINAAMVAAAKAGRTVVRLKGGDPDIFARSAEETEALSQAGIAFETVPGVTAALAAAGYAGIPITHSQHASALALITGHERHDKRQSSLNYAALAGFPGTLIFYMGITSAPQWSEMLVQHGRSPETPTMIVRRCTWNDQETIRCTLGSVGRTIAERGVRPPAIIIVGEVAGLAPHASWFTAKRLFGQRVLVTRPRCQARALVERLEEMGALVSIQPAIRIGPPSDWGKVDAALERIDQYDWLVFSSSNGVQYLLDRLEQKHGDLRRLGGLRLAAIGPGTAEELARYRLRADFVPDEYRAEALAEKLAGEPAATRFLLARASRGREVLAETLAAAGHRVEQVVVYSSADVEQAEADVLEAIESGRLDWITVTSSSIARSLVRLFGQRLRRTKLASISPVTSAVLQELGYPPTVEAAPYTMEGVAEAIQRHQEGSPAGQQGSSDLLPQGGPANVAQGCRANDESHVHGDALPAERDLQRQVQAEQQQKQHGDRDAEKTEGFGH